MQGGENVKSHKLSIHIDPDGREEQFLVRENATAYKFLHAQNAQLKKLVTIGNCFIKTAAEGGVEKDGEDQAKSCREALPSLLEKIVQAHLNIVRKLQPSRLSSGTSYKRPTMAQGEAGAVEK